MWGGTAAVAVLGAAGLAAVGWASADAGGASAGGRATASAEPGGSGQSGPAPTGPTAGSGAAAGPSGSTSAGPSGGSPGGSPGGASGGASGGSSGGVSAGASGSATGGPSPSDIPASGPGTFTTASGSSAKVGKGTALRYRVDVEDGLSLSAAAVARQVEIILGDRRGWTADGRSAFQRVSGGTTDFVVRVATPGTVDKICGEYGLDTGGEVNCNVADNVMVNLKRWLLATPVYAKDVTAYRALIVNHEVGHFLGHGHVGCPGPGRPAPAMMQQIKGMDGCVPNVWPYDDQGQPVTGPAVP
ncbi:DUF3152 domain-containing protein [Streptomyces zaehneri]|uniref:DUF3152 domain-containing protein n=1 Tax=Streptomyces zaehneri TaxID=3051180 RepID=UPI0028D5C8BD|nr:DUF3152 domain-containing protein [Streptomyces sp. DSM 40713]